MKAGELALSQNDGCRNIAISLFNREENIFPLAHLCKVVSTTTNLLGWLTVDFRPKMSHTRRFPHEDTDYSGVCVVLGG